MGGLRDRPLIGKILWVLPLLLWAVPLPSSACHFNPQAFQSNIPIHGDLLPNGMMAMLYKGEEQESCPTCQCTPRYDDFTGAPTHRSRSQ